MATPTYTAIASITLGSSASSVTFSSIPQDYRDLVLVVSTRSDDAGSADNMGLYFNSNISDYSTVRMLGTGSSVISGTNSGGRIAQLTVPAGAITEFGIAIVNVMDYSSTDKHTTALVRSNTASDQVHAAAGRWGNTAAVISVDIDLYVTSANFVTGSTFALYGIAS